MRIFYTKIKAGTGVGIRGMIRGTMGAYCGRVVNVGRSGEYVMKVECSESSYRIFTDVIRSRNWDKYCKFDVKM